MSILKETERDSKLTGLRRSLQAGLLLLHNLSPHFWSRSEISRWVMPSGEEYDLYERSIPISRTVVLIYGLDLAGERDIRLVRFACACADSGIRVVVPSLAGLKKLRFDPADLEAITELTLVLHKQYHTEISMIGFSAGGSIALLAAADPSVAHIIDLLILFSPYYSLPDLRSALISQGLPQPRNARDWDHFIWSQLVLAYHNKDTLGFSETDRMELEGVLYRYCTGLSLVRKKQIYQRLLNHHRIPGLGSMVLSPETLESFSPCGKLNRVNARVMILHDPNDRLIPPSHSQRILDELQLRGRPEEQKLVVTPLLSHVTLASASKWRIPDCVTVLQMLGELFRR